MTVFVRRGQKKNKKDVLPVEIADFSAAQHAAVWGWCPAGHGIHGAVKGREPSARPANRPCHPWGCRNQEQEADREKD